MTKEEHIKYWLTTAEHDLDVAESLFDSKKYDYCLYIGHLVLEKVLKAFWVRDNHEKTPPKIHNLTVLVSEIKLNVTEDYLNLFRKINDFNIEARYPDAKLEFYKICNYEYAKKYFEKIKEIYRWLLNQI